jgi:4-hydroxy-tetrahydrodipicolinate synthase
MRPWSGNSMSQPSLLPPRNCFVTAVATPVTPALRPDIPLLLAHCRFLLANGCDGIALFGTTGEGAEFAIEDRIAALDEVIAGGIEPGRILVSVVAASIPETARLARHALDRKVHGVLLMPPCVYRNGISDEGTFRFFAATIELTGRPNLRLYLYHFPDICGARVTPIVIRRLEERFPAIIAGVKDSGGDIEFTEALIRRFSHLSIFTGTEIHLPEALTAGGRGTICGLGNVMPRLLRGVLDLPTAFDRRLLVPTILAGDTILSRATFHASIKAVLAETNRAPTWQRVLPPHVDLPIAERSRLVNDFLAWDARLADGLSTFRDPAEAVDTTVVAIRRA